MRGFFQRMAYSLQQFMYGRYGLDELSKVLNIVSLALWVVSLFVPYLYPVVLALLIWTTFRTYSRNIYSRQKELNKYLQIKGRIKQFFKLQKDKWINRHTHKYYKCPSCKANLRVPRNRGKIEISCPKCHTKFIKKT